MIRDRMIRHGLIATALLLLAGLPIRASDEADDAPLREDVPAVSAADDSAADDSATTDPAETSPDADGDASDSLDDELLKSLGEDEDPVIEDMPAEEPAAAGDATGEEGDAAAAPGESDLDEELLRGLEDGEDIGEDDEDPLLRVGRQMRAAETLIARSRAGEETQEIQRKIVAELDELIKEALRKQQQAQSAQQSKKQRQQTAKRQQVKQPQPRPGQPRKQASNQPAADSTAETRADELEQPDLGALQDDLIKRAWGMLPAREREQMLQAYQEEFLPEYQQLIEEYFKALVERQQDNP